MRGYEYPIVTPLTREEYMERRAAMQREKNDHHLFYHRRNFNKAELRRLRNFGGFILRNVDVPAHDRLHRERFHGPPVPTRQQADELVELAKQTPVEEKQDKYWGARLAIDYFRHQAETHQQDMIRLRSAVIAEHLETQLGYFEGEADGRLAA